MLDSYKHQHQHNFGGSSASEGPKAIHYTKGISPEVLASIDAYLEQRAPFIWGKISENLQNGFMMRLTALWCLWILAGWTPFDLESRLYFVHIPKTAGTTLRTLLEMQVSAEEILYPYRNRKTAKAPVVQELVSGHLPSWLCKDLDPDFEAAFKVTILRDPVERYLSFLRAKKFQNPEFPNLESVMRERDSPVSKYNSGLIDNAHCRHLAANPLLKGRELLESAKESLRRIDCVIFFDRFADDVAALFQRLGISLERQDIPRVNFTQKEPVSEELLKEIRQINLLDLELYQYAKTHLQMKRNGYRLRTKSFDSLLTKTTEVDYRFDQPLNGKWWSYRESTGEHVGVYSTYRWVMNQPAIIYFSLEAGERLQSLFHGPAPEAGGNPQSEGQWRGVRDF